MRWASRRARHRADQREELAEAGVVDVARGLPLGDQRAQRPRDRTPRAGAAARPRPARPRCRPPRRRRGPPCSGSGSAAWWRRRRAASATSRTVASVVPAFEEQSQRRVGEGLPGGGLLPLGGGRPVRAAAIFALGGVGHRGQPGPGGLLSGPARTRCRTRPSRTGGTCGPPRPTNRVDEGCPALAQVYRRFGEAAAETSPLYERVAVALSESDAALRAIEAAPARKRHPTVILAALHDLALAGRAPALAAAYAAADGDAAAGAAIDTLLRDDRLGRGHRRAPAAADRRDRTLRRAVSGHRRGGAPGGRGCGRADRRGLFGWAQSQCRSRRHHLQQRTVAGRPVISRAAVVVRSWETGPSRRGRCPRSSPGSASTSIRST